MEQNSIQASPLLKWVGGKSRLKTSILQHFPSVFGGYFEPFLGGGAIFFSLGRAGSVVSDINRNLVDFYRAVASHPKEMIESLERIEREFNSLPQVSRKDWHAALRSSFNEESQDQVTRASMFLALNKTSFNGLYRENAAGKFNVPYNSMTGALKLFDRATFLRGSKLLAQTELLNEPFERVARRATQRDLVYFDPPYVPLSETSAFTAYSKGGFGEADQLKLIRTSVELVNRGAHVIVSNSYSPWVLDNYPESHFTIHPINVMRGVAAKASSRGVIKEALIVSK